MGGHVHALVLGITGLHQHHIGGEGPVEELIGALR